MVYVVCRIYAQQPFSGLNLSVPLLSKFNLRYICNGVRREWVVSFDISHYQGFRVADFGNLEYTCTLISPFLDVANKIVQSRI